MNLFEKSVLVTGSAGFLGRHLCRALESRGAVVHGCRSAEYDLMKPGHAHGLMNKIKPQVVIHAAARVGGIGANSKRPYAFARDNLLMGINTLDAAIANNVEKFVLIGTTCSYPENCPVPFREDMLWNGSAEPTNAPYGHAKRILMEMVAAAVNEGRLNCGTTAIMANLYGPGDSFDLETSHVIPAIIRKVCESKDHGRNEVELWGSGRATRDFLFVRDAAEGICRVCEDWHVPYPINLGTRNEHTIRSVADLVSEIVGFDGDIIWNGNGLDGQRRRQLDTQRAWDSLKWEAKTWILDGLRETVKWWREHQ